MRPVPPAAAENLLEYHLKHIMFPIYVIKCLIHNRVHKEKEKKGIHDVTALSAQNWLHCSFKQYVAV